MLNRFEISAILTVIFALFSAGMIIGNSRYGDELFNVAMTVCLIASSCSLGGLSVLQWLRSKKIKEERRRTEKEALSWQMLKAAVAEGYAESVSTCDLMAKVEESANGIDNMKVHKTPLLAGSDRCARLTPSPNRSLSPEDVKE